MMIIAYGIYLTIDWKQKLLIYLKSSFNENEKNCEVSFSLSDFNSSGQSGKIDSDDELEAELERKIRQTAVSYIRTSQSTSHSGGLERSK